MDRRRALAASRDEVRRLAGQPISEVTPSRRDFSQYVATQKRELAVIARLAPAAATPGQRWSRPALIAHARACDDAEVAALAVATGADGLSIEDLAAVADATTASILRDDLILHPNQLYHSRLHGADAAILPASELDGSQLRELVIIAGSLHMASVIEIVSAADIEVAADLPHVLLGLRCMDEHGALDLERTCQLARQLPRHYGLIVLPEISAVAECAALRGICDAVVAGKVLVSASDLGAALQALTG